VRVTRIATGSAASSLFWDGDELVDVVGGLRRWDAEGHARPAAVSWGYPFDQAIVSPSGRFHVMYAERGTKAAVLSQGRLVRELNRSFSHATDYDYPVALGRLPDGREIVAHCPDHYNQLEIEELESGRRLTAGALAPGQLGVWSVSSGAWRHRTSVGYPVGTMIARGDQVIGLHGHPRLIDPSTGTLLDEWPDVVVSVKNGSYGVSHVPTPVAALHPDRQRLAIAQTDHIAVVHLPAG
jgi:hypothetical protein